MTLDAMRRFAVQQLDHYRELIAVLDKIKVDPLSVLPPAERRAKPKRRARAAQPPEVVPTAAKAYALAAVRKLGLATNREIVAFAKRKGWGTLSKTPDTVMAIELKKLVAAKVLRRVQHAGRQIRFGLATPTKANAAKLAGAQALLNATPVPGAGHEVVN